MYLLSENRMKIGQIIAKIWEDPAFKKKFIEKPKTVLADYGIDVPADKKVNILENTATQSYFMLPEVREQMQNTFDTTPTDQLEAYQSIIAKAWKDPEYKAKLLADPEAVLTEAGIDTHGTKVSVVEEHTGQTYILLPIPPKALTDEQLDSVAGGGWVCSTCSGPPSCYAECGC